MRLADRPSPTLSTRRFESQLEQHRVSLTRYCGRMLGSRLEAEDAVQETLLRAWRSADRFEGRAALGSWLYRIARNVCVDMLDTRARRPLPVDPCLNPASLSLVDPDDDPAELTMLRDTVRLALVGMLHSLPPRQRAVLILRDVLRWRAREVAELLDSSVASVNSALQRAHATLEASSISSVDRAPVLTHEAQRALLMRYVEAFQNCDIDALASLGSIEHHGAARSACAFSPP
jgi:RNA polymerase sigma-70 factor, ECF subfamily